MPVVQADEIYRKPCIYMQLDALEPADECEVDDGQEGAEDFSPELRLVPQDSGRRKWLADSRPKAWLNACFLLLRATWGSGEGKW